MCAGSLVLAPVVYITDVCESEVRGKLGSITQMMTYFGVLFTYAVGSLLPWESLAACSAVLPIITILVMVCVPESPRFLLENNKVEKAMKSLCWLRGTTSREEVQEELDMVMVTNYKCVKYVNLHIFNLNAQKN